MRKYARGMVVAGLGLVAFAACNRSSPVEESSPPPTARVASTESNAVLLGDSKLVRTRLADLGERFTLNERFRSEKPGGDWIMKKRPLIRAGAEAP